MPFGLLAFALFSAQTLGILLWIGLAALTVALLVLMRTRWGQTKPVSKCVWLSIFAHVLFGGYAYGTKLVFDAPSSAGDRTVRLKMLDASGDRPEPAELSHGEPQPWDKLAADSEHEIAPAAPRPRMVERAADSDISAANSAPKLAALPADLALAAEPSRPTVEVPTPEALKPNAPAPSVAQIEAPAPERRDDKAPLGPLVGALKRASTADIDEEPSDAAPKVPSELVETKPREAATSGASTIPVSTVARATDSKNDTPTGSASDADVRPLPRRAADGDELPPLYQFRVAPDRLGAAKLHGGNARTEAAVEAALHWLAVNQSPDGRWDASQFGAGRETKTLGQDRGGAGAEADTGVTGLALLALLAAGNTHLEGKYKVNVQRGLEFLLRTQRDDGSLAGKAELFAAMYCHGMASLALSEAYAMTGDQRLKPFVEKAVRYTVAAQHTSGGWRYQPGDQGDMSQFGWQVMALKSAELAGIEIPERTRTGMARFLRSASSGKQRGLASYRAGEGASRTMTAEALVCRVFLNADREPATLNEAADFVVQELPQNGRPNLYYWYYGTLSLYQLQDSRWERWNEALQEQLLKRQRTDGELAGSFDTDDAWGGYGGRVYTTAIAALSLEVYYRYLPLYDPRK